ncbi:MAG: hypothetical protein PHT07_10495 [Paludibacter sp.]|nr:hypothetical protein [Paludibacter sp.]
MLPAVVFLMLMLGVGYYSLESSRVDSNIVSENHHSYIDPASRTFHYRVGEYKSIGGYEEANASADDTEKEQIETALIRTCRTVSTIAHSNGCSTWRTPSQVWAFVGTSGTSGLITNIYSGTTSPTLAADCSNMQAYGKYLFANTIPLSFVTGKNYTYNLSGLNDSYIGDVCGYTEIVGK